MLLLLIKVLGGLVTLVAAFYQLRSRVLGHRQKALSAQLFESMQIAETAPSFSDGDIRLAIAAYSEPDCSNEDPAIAPEAKVAIGVREKIFASVNRELDQPGKKHLLILADSGMGKTSFLLNLFARELEKPLTRRRRFACVSLARPDSSQQIDLIANKRATTLLLDALDEDVTGNPDYETRVFDILSKTRDFANVIVTCRSQYFPNEESIPIETGIKNIAPRAGGVSSVYRFLRIYISPFTEEQVEQYLKRAIPVWEWHRRRRAIEMARKIHYLVARPMFLSQIPDLTRTRQEVKDSWELYHFMVESWYAREEGWIEPRQLKRASRVIARVIFMDRLIRQAEFLAPKDFAKILSLIGLDKLHWQLSTRSLLNRDAAGNHKFAHRSIMEYLLVEGLIEEQFEISDEWTDMMKELFISWGKAPVGQENLRTARFLLSRDLSKSGLFPVSREIVQFRHLDVQWVLDSLRPYNAFAESRLPPGWYGFTGRRHQRESAVEVFQIADELRWSIPATTRLKSSAERSKFRCARPVDRRIKPDAPAEDFPRLSEFASLLEILATVGKLQTDLDARELYWLAEQDSSYTGLATVRTGAATTSSPIDLAPMGLVYVASGQVREVGAIRYCIDVYKLAFVDKIRPLALHISVRQGDASTRWAALSAGSPAGTVDITR